MKLKKPNCCVHVIHDLHGIGTGSLINTRISSSAEVLLDTFKCLHGGIKSLCNKYAAENGVGLLIALEKGFKIQNRLEKSEITYRK